nr:tail fiber protein [Methylophilales phage MEP431]
MANSFVRYVGDGNTSAYSIPFSYRSTADLTVTLAGVATTAFTLNAAGTTLTFSSPPANTTAIEIRRRTSQGSKLVDYASGSVLTENDLDTDSEQAFFMSQEAIDDAGDVIKIDNTNFQWDTQNKRLTNVADPVNNNDAVNKQFISTNLPNITTVSGISADVTTVAGISANVTTVANDATDIGLVATNIADVSTVATNIADVVTVANDLNEAISEIETAANDLNEATSEIDTVSNNIANVNTVGTNIANVNTVAGNNTNVTTVASNNANISTVAGISANVTSVAGISGDVTSVANDATDIGTVATDIANVNTVATNVANVNTVAGNNANITTVAGVNANVTTVAGVASDVTSVANNNANVTTVAGAITNVNNVGNSIASVNTVATNLASVNSFANTYLGASATAPTQDPDGSSLDLGDLYFDTTSDTMKVYSSGGWINAGSAVNGTANRFKYTATASQTTFTGSDDNSNTLAYDAGFIDVYLNGIRLVNGSDFTATSGTSIVLTTGASVNDILEIVAFGTFSLSNFSITDANDVPALGSAGQALVVNSGGTALEFSNASSAEVYGFHKDSNGDLIVTTTNQGVDNISSATYATFDDVLFSASGFTFSLNNGELIATI